MPTLHWIGKNKVINHHTDVPFRVLEHKYTVSQSPEGRVSGDDNEPIPNRFLKPVRSESGNKIIHGDNLDALKALLPEYEGRINCIYIDPPYNTGNEGWVYNDNVNDPKIRKWLGQVVGKEAEDLTRHDKWLCMMYPRLKLLHKLLADDGAIFISIDDNEQANLKLICDEIFGGGNFVVDVIWQHSIQPKGYLGKFSIHHNHTLIYSKSNVYVVGSLVRTDEHNKAYKNPDNDPRGLWRSGDVRNALYRPNLIYSITTPSGKVILPPNNGWRWSKETVIDKISTGEIVFNKDETNIIRKIYLDTIEGRTPESLWFGNDVGTTREANQELKSMFNSIVPFDTPKPTRLIERVLQIATSKDSIILDSFAGSGTTAHAVLNLNKQDGGNRKFILVEMEDYAESITAERVKRVINGYGDKEGTGGSFDYYELGEPLFLEDGNLNETVGVEKIRSYIWYTETQKPMSPLTPKGEQKENSYLGVSNDTAYFFHYQKDEITTLNHEFLSGIKTKAEQYVIYADNCVLTKAFMTKHHIIFKKIPRDITRF